jgi:hypothetical protein
MAVLAEHIIDATIEATDIKNGAVTADKIAAGAITGGASVAAGSKIGDKTITGAQLVDATITDTQLNSSVVALSTPLAQPNTIYAPTVIATNYPEWMKIINAVAAFLAHVHLTTMTLRLVPIYLRKGQVVTNITFTSSDVAADTPLNWWFALFSPAKVLLSQTADQTTTAWGATTAKTLALAAAQTIAADGVYYVGICMKATTPINVLSFSLTGTSANNGNTADNALTTTAPATAGAITAAVEVPVVTLT